MPTTLDSFNTFYSFNKVDDKDPIVFIHGVGLSSEIWYPQTKFFKNYNTLIYDLPGHGKTPLNKSSLQFDDYTKQLLKLIDELNFKKIHLVGFSLGALIARDFASKYCDRLRSLILHSSIYKRTEDQKRVVINRLNLAKLNKPTSKTNALRRWLNESYIRNNPEIYKQIYKILENNDRSNFLKSYKLFTYFEDDDGMIDKITVNTLITTGENDVGSTPEMSKNLCKKIKGSEFVEIKEGKHLCSIECDENVNIAFKKFIDKNSD